MIFPRMGKKRNTRLAILLPTVSVLLLTGCGRAAVTSVERGVLSQSIDVTGELVSADTISMMPPSLRRVWQYQVKQLAPEGSAPRDDRLPSDRLP